MSTAGTWPVASLPWPRLNKSAENRERREIIAATGAATLWAVGPAERRPLRIGSAADPREMLKRLAKASPLPLYVHAMRWGSGVIPETIIRSVQKRLAGHKVEDSHGSMWFDVDLATFDAVVVEEAGKLRAELVGHVEFMANLDSDAVALRRRKSEEAQKLALGSLRRFEAASERY